MHEANRFTDFIQAHIEKTDPHRIFIDKMTTRRVTAEAGITLPDCYQLVKNPEEINFSALPECFVLKPTHLAAKKGVYVLYRVKDRFIDLFTRKILSKNEIISDISKAIGGGTSSVIAEELIVGENGDFQIPYDYKLYTFDDGVKLIIQIDRNKTPNEICILDDNFQEFGKDMVIINTDHAGVGIPKKPANFDDMMSTARKIISHIDRPFVSVDLFTTGNRVILGELTPAPGGPYFGGLFRFSPSLDLYLGKFQADGYVSRDWEIPFIKNFPPSRIHDLLFK